MNDYNFMEEFESLFDKGEGLDYEPNPVLDYALSQNIFIQDLFYTSLREGNLEDAEFWGRIALESQGIDIEYLDTSTSWDELENFDPEGSNDVYDAADAMEYWECQGETNRCAQFAQLFVIEEAYGIEIDPDLFCMVSEQLGWFSEEGGTSLEDMNKMLDLFGIENELSQGKSFDDLLDCLEGGGRVIVAVDSGEYWDDENFWEDEFGMSGADHAIEVIGFDPETNCVIVNDSGSPNGCGCEIPLDTFLDAWEDSGNLMVECFGVNEH